MILKNNLYKILSTDLETKAYHLELIPSCLIYKAHFPEQPVTPGVCIIQVASELLSELYPLGWELVSVANAKFLAVINPLETKELEYAFKKIVLDEENRTMKVSVVVSWGEVVFAKLSLVYTKR